MESDWKKRSLGEVLRLEYGKGLPDSRRSGEGYPVYGSNGVIGHHDHAMIEGPGVIVGRKGTVGAVWWSDSDFWPIDTTYFVRPTGDARLRWVYFMLESLRLSRLDSSTGVPGLNRHDAYQLIIQVPRPAEQSKIAEILRGCQAAIAATRALINKHERIKQGLMQDLLSKGIDKQGRIRSEKTHKFKNSPAGRIPEEWRVESIGHVCELINGRAFKPREWSKAGLPIVRIENLNNPSASFNYCNFDVPDKFAVKDGDLLISWSGTPETSFGIFVWNRGPAVLNQHIFKVRFKGSDVSLEFFYWAYRSILAQMIGGAHGGVGLRHITKKGLAALVIPIPSDGEQNRIAKALNDTDLALNNEREFAQKLLSLKNGLTQDLLTGRVRITKSFEIV